METLQLLLPETYRQSATFRNEDIYLPEMEWELLVVDFFPPTFTDVVQGLSNTVASFYGLMLKEAGNMFGTEIMDKLSKATLYALGQRTVKNILAKKPDLDRDARGIAIVTLAAVFTASPEYKFQLLKFDATQVKMLVKGTDRYHRIALQLGIAAHLSSPIGAFVQGINDGLGLQYTITCEQQALDENSRCLYDLNIVL